MISVQIEDAKMKFLDLEKLEANGWVMPQKGNFKTFYFFCNLFHLNSIVLNILEIKVAKKRAVVPTVKPKVTAAKSGLRAMIEARRKAIAGKSEPPAAEDNKV
jgi:hypothetical protein